MEPPQSPSDEFQDCPKKLEVGEGEVDSRPPMLSLHALNDSQGHNIMGLSATIDQCEVIVLVDFGSTHNFLDCHLLKKLQLLVDPSCKLKGMVTNRV